MGLASSCGAETRIGLESACAHDPSHRKDWHADSGRPPSAEMSLKRGCGGTGYPPILDNGSALSGRRFGVDARTRVHAGPLERLVWRLLVVQTHHAKVLILAARL